MRCKNTFIDDRICDMCKLVNVNTYEECVKKNNEKIELNEKLFDIRRNCKYKTSCWDEYTAFDGCNKNGKGHGRFAEECNVCLECENIPK